MCIRDRISSYTDGTHVETVTSGTIVSAEGTVWYVEQTALAAESKRTNIYGTDSGDNVSAFLVDTWTFHRSFIFSAESGTVNYREVGWSHTASAGPNLFGRDLFAGGGVVLVAGQQLKVIVEMTVKLSPASSTPWVNVIAGWSQDGDCGIEYAAIFRVDASGGPDTPTGSSGLEPSTTPKAWTLTNAAGSIAAMASGNPPGVSGRISAAGESYVSGSFSRKFTGKAAISELNAADHQSIHFGERHSSSNQTYGAFRVLLDAAETKLSTYTLELEFTISWGRILTN